MFRGRFAHTIDSKGRMSIPSGYRSELERGSGGATIVTTGFECLHVYPFDDWREVEREIVENTTENVDSQAFQRMRISGAAECPIDKQGRMLIPQYLREHAGLEREVTIAGVGRRLEIWDKARFEADLKMTHARYPEIVSRVAGERQKES